MFDGKHLAGAAKTRLHFVDDHQYAVLIADLTDLGQEAGRRWVEAAFTEHRLKHDRRGIFRVGIGF